MSTVTPTAAGADLASIIEVLWKAFEAQRDNCCRLDRHIGNDPTDPDDVDFMEKYGYEPPYVEVFLKGEISLDEMAAAIHASLIAPLERELEARNAPAKVYVALDSYGRPMVGNAHTTEAGARMERDHFKDCPRDVDELELVVDAQPDAPPAATVYPTISPTLSDEKMVAGPESIIFCGERVELCGDVMPNEVMAERFDKYRLKPNRADDGDDA